MADDELKTPKEPKTWGDSKKGVKTWSEGRRTDDPDKRAILAPTGSGIGDGKVFHFLFGLKVHSPNDRRLFSQAREHVDDDVSVLRDAGFTVVIDEEATHPDFLDAVYGRGEGIEGLAPVGIFWLAHGHENGDIETSDGGVVRPTEIDAAQVHEGLKLVVFAACYTGSTSKTWRKALGGSPMVVGWGRPVTLDRAVEFLTPDDATETDLDDLLRRYVLAETPVPTEHDVRWSPFASAAATGRSTDLSKRLEGTLAILHAKKLSKDGDEGPLVVDVPLEEEPPHPTAPPGSKPRKRWHRAKVFILDGREPFCEGELLLGVECDVGELSAVVDVPMLLSGVPDSRFAKVTLIESDKDTPTIVTQGFLPLVRVRDVDAAALIYHVCQHADVLEKRIFGGDRA